MSVKQNKVVPVIHIMNFLEFMKQVGGKRHVAYTSRELTILYMQELGYDLSKEENTYVFQKLIKCVAGVIHQLIAEGGVEVVDKSMSSMDDLLHRNMQQIHHCKKLTYRFKKGASIRKIGTRILKREVSDGGEKPKVTFQGMSKNQLTRMVSALDDETFNLMFDVVSRNAAKRLVEKA